MTSTAAPLLEPAETIGDLTAGRGHSTTNGCSTCCTAAPP